MHRSDTVCFKSISQCGEEHAGEQSVAICTQRMEMQDDEPEKIPF